MPVKFSDIPKSATEVLKDDYVTGYKLKTKVQTSWNGSVLSSDNEVYAPGDIKTPGKLTWKFPRPFGFSMFSIDKMELDKAGKYVFEVSSDKIPVDGLKVVAAAKPGFADPMPILCTTWTYTGLKDTQIILADVTDGGRRGLDLEVTRTQGFATMGAKASIANLVNLAKKNDAGVSADFGVRAESGPLFAALMVKPSGKMPYEASTMYKASNGVTMAASGSYGSGWSSSVGFLGQIMAGMKLRAKIESSHSKPIACSDVSCSVKYDVSPGFVVIAGATFSKVQPVKYGFQVSIE